MYKRGFSARVWGGTHYNAKSYNVICSQRQPIRRQPAIRLCRHSFVFNCPAPKSAQFTSSLAPQETLQPQLQSLEKTTLPDSQPNEPTFTLAEIESQQRAQAEIDAHIARISQTKNLASLNSELEKEFDNEAIDYDWAAEHEETLTEVFYTEESLAQYAVNNIECKTTKCKINFPASDIAQANEISEKFTQALMNSDAGKDGFGVIISPDSTGGVNMFINRSGS